jgi:hypothetical protein
MSIEICGMEKLCIFYIVYNVYFLVLLILHYFLLL